MRAAYAPIGLLAGAVLLSCSASTTAADGRVMSVQEVIDHIDALNARNVRVAGYLGTCRGYDCILFANEADKLRWDRFISDIIHKKQPVGSEPAALGIGMGDRFDFDGNAALLNNSYVVITGRVSNKCRRHGEPACTDRSTDLQPIAIERGQPPARVRQESRS